MKKILLSLTLIMLSTSLASAGVIANTATVLPGETLSFTAGGTVLLNSPLNTDTDLGFFAMLGIGLGSYMDLGLKYIYQDFIGLDLETSLTGNKRTQNISLDLGINYRLNSNLFGASVNLLASKSFRYVEPYISLEDSMIFTPGGVANSLDFYVGIDIKLVQSLTLLLELDLPVLGYGSSWTPSALAGLCFYLGDSL